MLTIIFAKNDHGVHEVRIAGISQTIAVQPRFFAKITGSSPHAVAGIITDASVEMADELGFIVKEAAV